MSQRRKGFRASLVAFVMLGAVHLPQAHAAGNESPAGLRLFSHNPLTVQVLHYGTKRALPRAVKDDLSRAGMRALPFDSKSNGSPLLVLVAKGNEYLPSLLGQLGERPIHLFRAGKDAYRGMKGILNGDLVHALEKMGHQDPIWAGVSSAHDVRAAALENQALPMVRDWLSVSTDPAMEKFRKDVNAAIQMRRKLVVLDFAKLQANERDVMRFALLDTLAGSGDGLTTAGTPYQGDVFPRAGTGQANAEGLKWSAVGLTQIEWPAATASHLVQHSEGFWLPDTVETKRPFIKSIVLSHEAFAGQQALARLAQAEGGGSTWLLGPDPKQLNSTLVAAVQQHGTRITVPTLPSMQGGLPTMIEVLAQRQLSEEAREVLARRSFDHGYHSLFATVANLRELYQRVGPETHIDAHTIRGAVADTASKATAE